ncbi:CHRD domain-containing protein [Hufsiella ginkgonis]|uniref:CHRD domain-containing protein n=1 Tax=Hufsiella ginkgonis TaxID=2695274 RepID=A0A7K1Y143_9SPHI|nr:CHRD domain-containing protein [Hufsiella ginkgonis]MXV16396.1 CHRD domain-containing protein [Hufsiella ginkgonis]
MKRNMIFTLFLLTGMLCACTKGGDIDSLAGDNYTIQGAADTKQLVPAANGTAAATFSGIYSTDANVLTFTLGWTGLWTTAATDVITGISFYGPAAAGTNGTLARTISYVNSTSFTGTVSLSLSGNNGLTAAQREDLLAGKWYYLVCTQKFPGGIVRGQLGVLKQ